MKTFLKGLIVLGIVAIVFVGIPAILGYLITVLNFPPGLVEFSLSWQHGTFITYTLIGGYAIFVSIVILALFFGIKRMGTLW